MSFYVIAKQNDDFVDSPVFRAGRDGGDEAIALFTSYDRAQRYLASAGWEDEETIVELEPIEVLRWLLAAHEEEMQTLAVNPRFDSQHSVPQPSLSLPELLEDVADAVCEQLHAPAPPLARHLVAMDLLHCQKCGKLIEQKAGNPPQKCCGQTMSIAASNMVEQFASSH